MENIDRKDNPEIPASQPSAGDIAALQKTIDRSGDGPNPSVEHSLSKAATTISGPASNLDSVLAPPTKPSVETSLTEAAQSVAETAGRVYDATAGANKPPSMLQKAPTPPPATSVPSIPAQPSHKGVVAGGFLAAGLTKVLAYFTGVVAKSFYRLFDTDTKGLIKIIDGSEVGDTIR